MRLEPGEVRVLGALLEKQRLTPDAYPLTLNGLRAACNQSTARDPVMELSEPEVREALTRLGRRRLTRLTSGPGSRAAKFRHLVDETLSLSSSEQALLALLALRGQQTAAELRQRVERLEPMSAELVQRSLDSLVEKELAVRHPRRPGRKEERYAHGLGGEDAAAPEREAAARPSIQASDDPPDVGEDSLPDRVAALEDELGEVKAQLAGLRRELGL